MKTGRHPNCALSAVKVRTIKTPGRYADGNGLYLIDGVVKGLPKRPDRVNHHAAMRYAEVSSFIQAIRDSALSEPAKLAFEFLILTASSALNLRAPFVHTAFSQ